MKEPIDFVDSSLVLLLNLLSIALVFSLRPIPHLFPLNFGGFNADKVTAIIGASKVSLASACFQLP